MMADDTALAEKLRAAFYDVYDGPESSDGPAWRAVVRAAFGEVADLDAFAEPLRDAYHTHAARIRGEDSNTWRAVAEAAQKELGGGKQYILIHHRAFQSPSVVFGPFDSLDAIDRFHRKHPEVAGVVYPVHAPGSDPEGWWYP